MAGPFKKENIPYFAAAGFVGLLGSIVLPYSELLGLGDPVYGENPLTSQIDDLRFDAASLGVVFSLAVLLPALVAAFVTQNDRRGAY